MDRKFLVVLSDFGSDYDKEANNGVWTVEAQEEIPEEEKYTVSGTFDMNPVFRDVPLPNWLKIADFDTFISFNGKHESQIVQNAIEQGAFRSVNKIRKPTTCIVELAKGGLAENIQLVLENLIRYKESTDILRVRTPFGMIENVNLVGLEYSFKQGDCANMLVAKLQLQEVQSGEETLEYTLETVKQPQNTNTQNVGKRNTEEVKDETVNTVG